MRISGDQIRTVLFEIVLVVALLNAFATYKLFKKIDSLNVHIAALSSRSAPEPTVNIGIEGEEIWGVDDAPVTIVEFTDYECSFSGRHFEQTYPQINQNYVNDGRVRLVVRNFPLGFHPQALKAAEAAECAGDQGNYWGMHFKLFEHQADLSEDNYKKWAREIGLLGERFDECLDSAAMAGKVKKDIDDGVSYGVRGTPTFFINGKKLAGAQAITKFDAAIQRAIEEPVAVAASEAAGDEPAICAEDIDN